MFNGKSTQTEILLTVEMNVNVDGTLKPFSKNGVMSGGVGILEIVTSELFCLVDNVLDISDKLPGAVGIVGCVERESDFTDNGLKDGKIKSNEEGEGKSVCEELGTG